MRGTRGTLWFKIKIGPVSFIIQNYFRFYVTYIHCDTLSQFSDSVAAAIWRMANKVIWSCDSCSVSCLPRQETLQETAYIERMWWRVCPVDKVRINDIKVLLIQDFPDVTLIWLLGGTFLHQYSFLRLLQGTKVKLVDHVGMTAIQSHNF